MRNLTPPLLGDGKKAERADALAYGIRDIFSVFILFYIGGTRRGTVRTWVEVLEGYFNQSSQVVLSGSTSRVPPHRVPVLMTSILVCLKASVADLGCLSRIQDPNFSIPKKGSKSIRIRIKEFF